MNVSRSLMRKKQLEIMNEFSKSISLDVLNRSRRVQQMYNMKVKEFAQQQEEQLWKDFRNKKRRQHHNYKQQ